MKAFVALTRNAVRASFRNRTAMFFTLGLAVLFMVILGTVYGNSNVNLKIDVVDNDRTAASADFIHTLGSISSITATVTDLATARDDLRHDETSIVIVVPRGFAAAAKGPATAQLGIIESSGSSAYGAIAGNVVGQLASRFGGGGQSRITVSQPTTASVNNVSEIDFLLPAMIAYIILQSGINFVAIGLVDLRARKVLRRYRATPLTPAQILAAQVTAGAVTVVLQIIVLVVLGLSVFKAHMYGNWLIAAVPIAIGTLAFVGIGFLLTSAARTSEAARGLSAMIAFPMMFLSGIFIPLDQLPSGMQTAVHVLPLTWLSDALHQVFNDGAGLAAISTDLLVLAGWAVVTFALAMWRFRWD